MTSSTRRLALVATALSTLYAAPASACGIDSYLGSICTVGFNFCPRGWAEANGQLLPISQNTALFALLGTMYGGNGQTTFALPDLRGRVVVNVGQGPGLSNISQGETAGQEQVSLSVSQMPAHSHAATLHATTSNGNTDSPAGAVAARLPRSNIYSTTTNDATMSGSAISVTTAGAGTPVQIRNPYLGMKQCIALQGVFPPRN